MNHSQAMELLQKVIQINSVNGNEIEVATLLDQHLKAAGLETELVPEEDETRVSLVATLDSGVEGPTLSFSGHMDVVPVGEMTWDYDPFGGEIVDGKLYGRGATDMKAGLVAAVVAAIRLQEAGGPAKGKLKLLLTSGEEEGGSGSDLLTSQGYVDDVDAMIITEPTALNVANAHKGVRWMWVETYGQTAHGSRPHAGINAFDNMRLFIDRFVEEIGPDFEAFSHPFNGSPTYSFNYINAGEPAGTNVVPDHCRMHIDIRTVDEDSHDFIKEKVEALLEDLHKTNENFKGEYGFLADLGPLSTDADDPFTQLTLRTVEKVTDTDREPYAMTGGTDGANFSRAMADKPILICGPGIPDMAHQPNEHMYVDEFYDAIDILVEIAKEYLA